MKKKNVYLDMDGTIADLYNQPNWLARLESEDKTIFTECQPMTTEETLYKYFPKDKYNIKICSMTPKHATKKYCDNVISQKNKWLDKYFPTIKERHYLKYGNNKNYKGCRNSILVDDSETIRNTYKGQALKPMWLGA